MKAEEAVEKWAALSTQLAKIKEEEMALRKKLCAYILKDKIKGTKKQVIGKFAMKATAKLNQNIDKEVLATVWAELTAEEKACIQTVPKLIAKELKKLNGSEKIFMAIEEKPATPTLEVVGIDETGKDLEA